MKTSVISFLATLAVLSVLIYGCDKPGTNCLSGTGDIIFQERIVSPFDSITMNDDVNVILTYDSIISVTVEAGEKIIDGITTEVVGRNLVIHNLNVCNWTRDYTKPINVYVTTNYLWTVVYQSSGDLTSSDTLRFDSLMVAVYAGCGTIDLDLDITSGHFVENRGTADFDLHGRCGICYVYAGEYGAFHCEDLSMAYCFVTSLGSNDCWVNAKNILGVSIVGIGNVYYTGIPDSLYYTITGQGKLIHY